MVKVPGLDTPQAFARTGAVPQTDLARTFDRGQPVVVIDTRTRRRQLIWAELDANADTPANTALLIHPAVNFREGHRYIVALRRLRRADGSIIPAASTSRSPISTCPSAIARKAKSGCARPWHWIPKGSSPIARSRSSI